MLSIVWGPTPSLLFCSYFKALFALYFDLTGFLIISVQSSSGLHWPVLSLFNSVQTMCNLLGFLLWRSCRYVTVAFLLIIFFFNWCKNYLWCFVTAAAKWCGPKVFSSTQNWGTWFAVLCSPGFQSRTEGLMPPGVQPEFSPGLLVVTGVKCICRQLLCSSLSNWRKGWSDLFKFSSCWWCFLPELGVREEVKCSQIQGRENDGAF